MVPHHANGSGHHTSALRVFWAGPRWTLHFDSRAKLTNHAELTNTSIEGVNSCVALVNEVSARRYGHAGGRGAVLVRKVATRLARQWGFAID